jgi:hypothetical protein
MYKITSGNKTMVGCNEDAWRITPHIWFENKDASSLWGAVFTGSRVIGDNLYAPQSGMNTQGLAYSRLASYHPGDSSYSKGGKQKIYQPDIILKDVLHNCSSIAEAKAYWEKHDHSIYYDHILIYVDKSGDYLIVEPYTLITGNDPTYVLSNFCPSITTAEKARNITRYRNGEDHINKGFYASLQYCTNLSDTMHVCRSKQGDGTLLTSIWDTEKGVVNLYFYHDYGTTVQFNIQDELKLGNRTIAMSSLFPTNKEFQQLANYITPINTPKLRIALALAGLFFLLSAIILLINYVLTRREEAMSLLKLIVSVIGFLLFGYMIILTTTQDIFYFDAPYQFYQGGIINLSSYIPLTLGIVIISIIYYNYLLIRTEKWNVWIRRLLTTNSILFCVALFLFQYWGLFYTFT